MLAELERQGVEVWINHAGTHIAVRGKADLTILEKRGFKAVLTGDARTADGWYRPEESIKLSEEEAGVLAERISDAVEGLTNEQRAKLRGILERRFLEQFREFHQGKKLDLRCEPILKDASEFLTSEQVECLKKLIDR